MFHKLRTLFKRRTKTPEIICTVSGIVKDYTIEHEFPGTILILENEAAQTGRYHVDWHVHYVRQEHPIGSKIRLKVHCSQQPVCDTYMAQLAD